MSGTWEIVRLLPPLFPCHACPQFSLWKGAFLSSWAGCSVARKISPLVTLLLEKYSSANAFGILTQVVLVWVFFKLELVLFFWHSMHPHRKHSLPVLRWTVSLSLWWAPREKKNPNKTHKTNGRLHSWKWGVKNEWASFNRTAVKRHFPISLPSSTYFSNSNKKPAKTLISSGGCFESPPNFKLSLWKAVRRLMLVAVLHLFKMFKRYRIFWWNTIKYYYRKWLSLSSGAFTCYGIPLLHLDNRVSHIFFCRYETGILCITAFVTLNGFWQCFLCNRLLFYLQAALSSFWLYV